MNPLLEAVLLLFAGVFCGFLNTLASSGSAVSLPAMIFLGMDPGSANATNRLPVLAGAIAALFTFQRSEGLDWRLAARLTPPGTRRHDRRCIFGRIAAVAADGANDYRRRVDRLTAAVHEN